MNSLAHEAALSANFIPESVYDSLVEAVNKHCHFIATLREVALKKSWELKIWRCMMSTRHVPTDYKFLYLRKEALAKSEQVCGLSMITYPAWSAPSLNGGSTSMSTKGNAQVPIQVDRMVPMPLCWTGRYIDTDLAWDRPQYAL